MHANEDSATRRAFLTTGSLGAIAFGLARDAAGQGRTPTDTEQMNARIVTEFCESFAKGDAARATSLLAEKCLYRGTQTAPPVTGRDAVAERVTRMIKGGMDFKVLKTVTLGPIVVNERDDIPREPRTINGKVFQKFHVAAGVFF